jgi:hypothetical protein
VFENRKKRAKRMSKYKKFLDFARHTSGHSKGPGGHNAALKPGHDGRVEHANSQYLLELHAAFVLPATTDRGKQISTGDPARQRDFEPFIRKLTAD